MLVPLNRPLLNCFIDRLRAGHSGKDKTVCNAGNTSSSSNSFLCSIEPTCTASTIPLPYFYLRIGGKKSMYVHMTRSHTPPANKLIGVTLLHLSEALNTPIVCLGSRKEGR